jgi:GntR family transcriptional regulator, transcriptional repressor for pyruvate dehydrogenase complex
MTRTLEASHARPSPLPPIQHKRLTDRASEAIKDYILVNRLAAGDRLPSESRLSASLDVSRHIVRQAISSLEALGLVRVVHGRGMFVGVGLDTSVFSHVAAWINVDEITQDEYQEVRSQFDRGIYELVVARATDEELDRLQKLACAMRDAEDDVEARRLHGEFHRLLLMTTGNRFLMSLGSILDRFFWSLAARAPQVQRVPLADMRQHHVRLVEGLRRRRTEDVPDLIGLHLGFHSS